MDNKTFGKPDGKQALGYLSIEEAELKLAETSMDLRFLEEQVRCDFQRYSPESLNAAREKISTLKEKEEILKTILERGRNSNEMPSA